MTYFNELLNAVIEHHKVNGGYPMDSVFSVVDFDNNKPDVERLLKEDPSLAIEQIESDINYPDENSLENIVITNVQEKIYNYFENCI